jgi:hypothetical protein
MNSRRTNMTWSLCVQSVQLRSEIIVHFVDIGEIDDPHFVFMAMKTLELTCFSETLFTILLSCTILNYKPFLTTDFLSMGSSEGSRLSLTFCSKTGVPK